MTLDEFTYGAVAVLAFLDLALCALVIFRAKFCAPVTLLLVAVLSLYNFGLLLSGLQRLAQHSDLTIGVTPIVLGEACSVAFLGLILWDVRKSFRR